MYIPMIIHIITPSYITNSAWNVWTLKLMNQQSNSSQQVRKCYYKASWISVINIE